MCLRVGSGLYIYGGLDRRSTLTQVETHPPPGRTVQVAKSGYQGNMTGHDYPPADRGALHRIITNL